MALPHDADVLVHRIGGHYLLVPLSPRGLEYLIEIVRHDELPSDFALLVEPACRRWIDEMIEDGLEVVGRLSREADAA
jgi:hypothetical protein